MNPQEMRDKMMVYICCFEIETNEGVQVRTMKAPRLVLEREYTALVNEAARCDFPVRVKISRSEPFWNQYDDEWVEREYSIEFANNAYVELYGELE